MLALIAEAALQVSGYKNVPLAIALGILCAALAFYAVWPWIKGSFPHARTAISPAHSLLPAHNPDRSEPEERTSIHVTPAYLVGLFEGLTDLQAMKLTGQFVGKWMRLSGPLGNVLSNREKISQVTFLNRPSIFDPDYEHFIVYMYFDRKRWDDRLAVLPTGSPITVVGRLREFDRVTVHLEDCELE